ncbi:hypothetical protein [Hamadaea tsunoensis]|uniref:hypothetical protein n=1 Tax=Hamadaea tsunoensis TaxID=53368 RepID=UPI00040CC7F6|nr:hypothetical protein [Hamadaea tsunoensis]
MSDDKPPPYEPPASSGSDGTQPPAYEPPVSGTGYEPPVSGTGYESPAAGSPQEPPGGGSIYESASYQPAPAGSMPPPPEAAPPPGAMPPPGTGAGAGAYPAGGYPPGGAYAPPTPVQSGKDNTVLFGILSIIFAVVCCPLIGVLFGWLAINEGKKTGSDALLGKIGFWLGIAFTALALIGGLVAICAGAMSGSWHYDNY